MSQTPNDVYRRVYISGVLKLTSDLHLGTGEMDSYLLSSKDGQAAETSQYNCIALDPADKPYIPGSSLRGLLRSLTNDEQVEQWFGKARGNASDHGNMGRMRVYDARLRDDGNFETGCISRTAIDAVTGTAKQHHLATHKRVKAGAEFKVEIELDTRPVAAAELIQTSEVELLLATLRRLDGEQLGGGKSVGQGQVEWSEAPVAEGLSANSFADWLKKCLGNEGEEIPEAVSDLHHYATDISADNSVKDESLQDWVTETVYFHTQSPLLINDPQLVAQRWKEAEADKQGDKHTEDLVFMRQGDRAVIPGSTLKGWFRARCRKILLTLTQDRREDGADKSRVDSMLDQLFGSTEQASVIRFYDARTRFTEADKHIQTFNAVDRFTGGVKDGALYTVEALWLAENNSFTGRVSYRKDKITGWMQLLLLFAWRDAEEGDLVLGWGKAKGYGRLLMKTENGGTESWIKKCQDHLADWEAELTAELNKGGKHG